MTFYDSFVDELNKIANGQALRLPSKSKRMPSPRRAQTGGSPGESAFYRARRKPKAEEQKKIDESLKDRKKKYPFLI